ncbi:hypothetical protein [Promicromonospora sp. NPDC050249]|uniref:hypothetical protein n=1 Tax=Promicromonospora sp. NPDC050249 TaxID=3154743 RepID=UPI00340B974A
MTDEWHPRIGRRTLSGVSAHRLSLIQDWCLGIGMVCLVAGLVLWGADQAFLAMFFVLPGATAVSTARMLGSVADTRGAREYAAGYTTLVQGTGPADLEHVDPRTGRLVSFAGEDLTDAERRARVAAIRSDARLGVGQPDRLLIASGDDPADPAGYTDEDLFAGRPRTFITLPWSVRHGAVWGWFFVGLAPIGFLVFALFDASTSTPAIVAPVILGVVLVAAAIGAVILVAVMRRTDTMLGDGGPGGSDRSRGVVMSLWVVPLGVAVVLIGISVVATNDIAGARDLLGVAGLDRAAMMSAVWAVPWFVAWVVLVRRAATAELRS